MTVIHLPRDDQGLHRLREANAARSAPMPVTGLDASPRINPQPSPGPYIPVAPSEDRRRGERRQSQERRAQHLPTLLDTRDHYERRTHERRAQHPDSAGRSPSRGINVYT